MFLFTQIIGLFISTTYINNVELPYNLQPPKEIQEKPQGIPIITAFIIAILLFFLLMKIRADIIIRIWFFAVITIALGVAINAILLRLNIGYSQLVSLLIALTLTYFKVFKRDLIIHNLTELLIYPGIAAIFVLLLNIKWTILLLLLFSFYDIWAVWHSEVMQKMAKYQINKLRVFTGFFVPYTSKKEKQKIKELKDKYKNSSELEEQFKKSKIKINLAILGGGDVIFPIIAAGVFYKYYFSIILSLIITLFSTLALLYLFLIAKKGKFYPALPFITIGIYLAMILIKIIY